MAQTSTKSRGGKTASRNQGSSRSNSKRSSSKTQGNGRSSSRAQGSSRTEGRSSRRGGESSRQERESGLQGGQANRPQRVSGSSGSARMDGQQYLHKFFTDQLKDIYYAERKLVQALATMRDAATTEELRDAFEDHLHQTERHARRLEKVFERLDMRPEGKRCEAIEGIIREVKEIIEETEEGSLTRDAALIMGAQKAEHYEIATYGGLVTFAITMGLYEEADLLDRTLVEEEITDNLLTDIAEEYINIEAELESMEAMGEEEEGKIGEEEEEEMGEESGASSGAGDGE
ncbi:MAG TPA: ferritin-like domain-containing protein [Puia sp.]|uniref:YciE/YciF ferroxidase family protein n=1 Tax=Puia sp. TaxID=2045100 RepID=UPI002CBA4F27|nr:ferritin-like domain-containing protein [Puia sp.]HVU94600.1 ferritin-like domain-containing protein [Puia sp.]